MGRPSRCGRSYRCDRGVVLDEVTLGDAIGEELLVGVGDEQRLAQPERSPARSLGDDPHRVGDRSECRERSSLLFGSRSRRQGGFDLVPNGVVARLLTSLRYHDHRDRRLDRRLDQVAHLERTGPIRDVLHLAVLVEQVVGELGLQRGHHPCREGVLDEAEDRGESLLGGERTSGHGVDVCPVHDGPDKGKLTGEDGDVAQRAKRSIVPSCLEAKTNPESLDLWGHVLQAGADPIHQLIGRPLVGVAEVGTDHRSTKRPPQLHGVLEGSKALFGLVLLLDGENGEIGGMDREPDVPLRGQFSETGASLLLPGEAGDEGKLQCPVAPRRHIVEKRLVIGPLGRDPRNAKPDLSIVCHERTSVV